MTIQENGMILYDIKELNQIDSNHQVTIYNNSSKMKIPKWYHCPNCHIKLELLQNNTLDINSPTQYRCPHCQTEFATKLGDSTYIHELDSDCNYKENGHKVSLRDCEQVNKHRNELYGYVEGACTHNIKDNCIICKVVSTMMDWSR